jgi:uncharacterized protein with HEPN domain
MNERSYLMFLEDIIESIEKIEIYIRELTYNAFIEDSKTVDAVVRNLEIIGEASKRIPDNIKENLKEVPWHRMTGLRNIIAHEYFGIDLNIIWKIIKENLPEVKPSLKKLLKESE